MANIEQRVRELAGKWQHANMDAYDVLRDAAEELRVMHVKIMSLQREIDIYKSMNRPQFYPNLPDKEYKVTCTTNTLGWGKGKDE